MSLLAPPRGLHRRTLETVEVEASSLLRVSRFGSGEPHFGRTRGNRFDDPERVPGRRYGTCYFGFELVTALAETVLHDELPRGGHYRVAATELSSRHVVHLSGDRLVLADLTGLALKTMVGDGSLSTVLDHSLPQKWSRQLHGHPAQVDGLLYVSRHLNDRHACVLFDRAVAKLGPCVSTPLGAYPGALEAMFALRITPTYT